MSHAVYTSAAYKAHPTSSDSIVVAGPCTVRGIWLVPGDQNGSDSVLELYDGPLSDGVLAIKIKSGLHANLSASGKGLRYMKLPGRGVRFNTSLNVRARNTLDFNNGSVTIFYEGPEAS